MWTKTGQINALSLELFLTWIRIVNGYEPERRPWMALVEIRSVKSTKTDVGQCGGSILNKARCWREFMVKCSCSQPFLCWGTLLTPKTVTEHFRHKKTSCGTLLAKKLMTKPIKPKTKNERFRWMVNCRETFKIIIWPYLT